MGEGEIGMAKIEEILQKGQGNNLTRFNILKNAEMEGKLAVFWGAGLSLGGDDARQWGKPFTKMLKNLEDLNVDEYCKEAITDYLNDARKEIHAGNYPKAGCSLNTAFRMLQKSYNEVGDINKCYPGQSFNDFLVNSFEFTRTEAEKTNWDDPYTIPALFYIPFIGKRGITTNIDVSYDIVCETIGIDHTAYPVRWNDSLKRLLQIDNKDYAIHGSINNRESLVFTEDQYNAVYVNGTTDCGAKALLDDTVRNYTVLFLGASLQLDSTVEVINDTYKAHPEIQSSFFLVPVRESHYDEKRKRDVLDQITKLDTDYPFLISRKAYYEIPLLLLHLIRVSSSDWADCRWGHLDKYSSGNTHLDETLQKELIDFLNTGDRYAVMHIDSEDPLPVLEYLSAHHSIEHHDSGNGWSICNITKHSFNLYGNTEPPTVLHNCPLGDTIYIIAPQTPRVELYIEDAEKIEMNLHKWREALPVGANIDPRVRTIIFRLPFMRQDIETNRNYVDLLQEIYKPEACDTVEAAIELLQNPRQRLLLLSLVRIVRISQGRNLKRQDIERLLDQNEDIENAFTRVLSNEPEKYR